MNVRKLTAASIALCMLFPSLLALAGCAPETEEVLRVYNWEDYISAPSEGEDEGDYVDLIAKFEEEYEAETGKAIRVEYSTFGTNENMYNELKINPGAYDLVCPSDYMIMKMISEDMVEPFSDEFLRESNYARYGSPYIRDLFEANGWAEYAVPYMWGTMGILYAKDSTAYESSNYGTYSSMQEYVEANGWAVFSDPAMKNVFKLKNSMRDTYVASSIYTLLNEKSKYYDANATVSGAVNATDSATVAKIEEMMLQQCKLSLGLENDEAKEEILNKDIDMVLQWAGDALYAMTSLQEELGISRELNYFVPEEGSNIFCDGWCIPKYAKNTEAANLWINFMCRPDIAVRNMDYICYTSGVASQEAFDYLVDNWASEGDDAIAVDLSYFFGADCGFDTTIMIDPANYDAFTALFPTQDVIDRCAVMLDFGDATSDMNRLWRDVTGQ